MTAVALILDGASACFWPAVALALAAMTALMLFSTLCALRYVLRSRVTTGDQIRAGISMYLMPGLAFRAIFHLVSILEPGGFASTGEPGAWGGVPA
jgi:hypothetical protein